MQNSEFIFPRIPVSLIEKISFSFVHLRLNKYHHISSFNNAPINVKPEGGGRTWAYVRHLITFAISTLALEKVTSFPHKNCYGFFVVFIWFTIEIPSWKKCLFSTLENLQFPVWNFNFPNMENNFYSNLEKHGKFKIQEWF